MVMVTSEAPGGPSRRMRCLMSGPVADLWPRGRPDDATNARLVSHQERALGRYYRLWSRRRGSICAPSGTHSTAWYVAWIQSYGDADAGPFLPGRFDRDTHSGFSLTERSHEGSSVTVNPLQHERTVARSGSIDIPSTAWCVATISMLNIWQGSRAQPSGTI